MGGVVAQVPEVVLQEPQQRVADLVVVEVVGLFVGGDEADPVGPAVVAGDRDRAAGVLLRHLAVGFGPGAADPDGVGTRCQGGKRRNQAAGAAGGDVSIAFLVDFDRSPVGHDDGVPALKQVPGVLL